MQSSDRIGSPRTLQTYRYGVGKRRDKLDGDVLLRDVTPEHIEALLADLKASGMSPAGSAVYRPIRMFFRWCLKRGLLAVSPIEGVEAPRRRPRRIRVRRRWGPPV